VAEGVGVGVGDGVGVGGGKGVMVGVGEGKATKLCNLTMVTSVESMRPLALMSQRKLELSTF
jgi:hypothetical protein